MHWSDDLALEAQVPGSEGLLSLLEDTIEIESLLDALEQRVASFEQRSKNIKRLAELFGEGQ